MKSFLPFLKSQGARITKSRKAIVSVFENTRVPLSSLEIQSLLAKQGIQVNKTTVYREIEFLLAQNLITFVLTHEDQKKYERADLHHHHVVCRACGEVEDIDMKEVETLFEKFEKKLLKNKKFTNIMHSLEFFGVCKKCS